MQLLMEHKPDEWPTISIFAVPKGTEVEVIKLVDGSNTKDIKIGNISIHIYEGETV